MREESVDYLKVLAKRKGQRVGQYFVNTYILKPWPELYYCEDTNRALAMIWDWMQDHCYGWVTDIPELHR